MAKASKVSDVLRDFDERQLRSLVRAKKYHRRLEELDGDIVSLRSQLQNREREREQVTRKIARITGVARVRGGRGRRGGGLADAILGILRKHGPLGLTDVANAVLKAGYKTGSSFSNFRTTVAHTLRRIKKQLAKTAQGYAVKGSNKATRKPAKAEPAAATQA